uniref:DUF2029 domain-containing protein n=1 Tax=Ignisphaera aggregans TaxID=334771 RepID=A0A7J2U6K7_9CREN
MERETLKTLTVFMISLIIRLTIAVQGIHGTDILFHVNGSRSLLLTGSPYCLAQYNYPPLYSAIQLSSILALGWNPLGYKLMPVLFDSLLGLALYIITAMMTKDKGLALKTQIIWALNPLAIVASAWYGLFDSIPTLFALASIMALARGYASLSAVLVALGIDAKVFPALLLPPNSLHARNREAKNVLIYIAISSITALAIWLALSIKCLDNALKSQLQFHLQRLDKGLSLTPYTPYQAVLSLVVPTIILTVIALWMRLEKRFTEVEYTTYASLSLILLTALNPFIYPHYLIWFLPPAIASLVALHRGKGLAIATIITLVLSAIGLTYWRYYKVEAVVSMLRPTLYTTLIATTIALLLPLAKKHRVS